MLKVRCCVVNGGSSHFGEKLYLKNNTNTSAGILITAGQFLSVLPVVELGQLVTCVRDGK